MYEDSKRNNNLRYTTATVLLVFLVLIAGLSLWYGFKTVPAIQVSTSVTPTPVVTQITRRKEMYPDSELTPGDVFPNATKEIICVTGYTKTVRNVSTSLKKKVYAEYNLTYPQPTGYYEVDHFIPLAIGGSNDIKNLWAEPASPRPGFHEKDIVEVYLLDQVCHHGLDLKQAQESIRADWYLVYESIPDKKQYMYNVQN